MNTLSPLSTIDRIQAIESEVALLRVEAYAKAGLPVPSQSKHIARLVEMAAITFKVSEGAILGPTRMVKVTRARFAVMWAAREAFGTSSTVIGREIGGRDHSTVLSALHRAEEWRDADPVYREVTDRLLAIFTPKSRNGEAQHAASCH